MCEFLHLDHLVWQFVWFFFKFVTIRNRMITLVLNFG
jgi:hypothetical protein